jgi:hypothetical protein
MISIPVFSPPMSIFESSFTALQIFFAGNLII